MLLSDVIFICKELILLLISIKQISALLLREFGAGYLFPCFNIVLH